MESELLLYLKEYWNNMMLDFLLVLVKFVDEVLLDDIFIVILVVL